MFRLFSVFLLVLSFTSFSNDIFSQPKQTTIETIAASPASFEGDEVEIVGLVFQYFEDKGSTNYYLIKGDFGGIIRVNTAEPAPETNVKYDVSGIVYIDRQTQKVFISEKGKYFVDFPEPILTITPSSVKEDESATISWFSENAQKVTLNGELVSNKGSKTINGKSPATYTLQAMFANGKYKEKTASLSIIPPIINSWIYILGGALILLIGAFIFFQLRRGKLETEPALADFQEPFVNPRGNRGDNFKEAEPVFSNESDFKTIRVPKNSPKTLKFIPGKFKIISGKDKGKEFRIAGYPMSSGFIVTIGRKEVSGDRAFTHIYLNDMTVSREQSELHYLNNKLQIKNLSETNLTQLDGRELMAGEIADVTPNSVIKMGEVELQYII